MRCSKCNAQLQPADELRWECNACHQLCRANLSMLEQIQSQRDRGYTAAMVNCPFCGTVLDDGNETIHWICPSCGEQTTGTIKNYLKPELWETPEAFTAEGTLEASVDSETPETMVASETSEEPVESEMTWHDVDGAVKAEEPQKEETGSSGGFFADEAAKNEFLAETTSQALGEEIPDSIFEDTFPINRRRRQKEEQPVEDTAGQTQPESTSDRGAEQIADSTVARNAQPAEAMNPQSAGVVNTESTGAENAEPVETVNAQPTGSVDAEPAETVNTQPTESADAEPVETVNTQPTESADAEPTVDAPAETAVEETSPAQPTGSSYTGSAGKQIWPKIITGVLSVLIAAAAAVGIFLIVSYLIAPTRRFRSAVKAANYEKALEIYDNKIKGDTDNERIAQNAVEHYLNVAFKAMKNGTGDEAAYEKILDFAQNEIQIGDTSDYEIAAEPETSPTPEVTVQPEATASPEATAEATETPAVTGTPEPTAESTPEATVSPEATEAPKATEAPAPTADPSTGTETDVSAVLAKAKKYVKSKKYEKAYKTLSDAKDTDTTGQIAKEMSSVKKKWKSYNIKTFHALCDKLTIVYSASEKRYHIVPRGYYTNYSQISRSNNVGGIAYMDRKKKKVSITNIGKAGQLSSYGKTNRANLKKFKEMIEKYSYLAKEI